MVNKSFAGFTLIEMLLVLVILSLLAGIAAPMVSQAIIRSKESALKEDLQTMRSALDDYYADKGQYPSREKDLVEQHYLRSIPVDPITKETDWDWVESDDPDFQGIEDVKSLSDKEATDGTRYNEW